MDGGTHLSDELAKQIITSEWRRNKPRVADSTKLKLSKEATRLTAELLTSFVRKAFELAADEADVDAMANDKEIDPQHIELVMNELFLDH